MTKYLAASFAARLLFILSLISILGLALYPNIRLPEFTPSGEHSDLVYHAGAFILLTVLATIALDRNVTVVLSMVSLAIVLELLQAFVPGRGVFFIDAAASLFGVLIGALLAPLAVQLWRWLFSIAWRHGS